MDCSIPGFPVLHYLPEFVRTHLHWVGDTTQPSNPLFPAPSPALNLSQRVFIHQTKLRTSSLGHSISDHSEILLQRSKGEARIPWLSGKEYPYNARDTGDVGDMGSIPGSGRSPGGGNGNLLQYSCLGDSMDRGAWQATVQTITISQTRLSDKYTILNFNPKYKINGLISGCLQMERNRAVGLQRTSRNIWGNGHVHCFDCGDDGFFGSKSI